MKPFTIHHSPFTIHTARVSLWDNLLVLLFLILITSACAAASPPTQAEATAAPSPTGQPAQAEAAGAANTITLMSHDSFDASPEVIAAFEQANNVKIEFLRSGDAGAALNQAILSKENPLADIFWGVDNTFFSRAVDGGIFEPYASPMLADIPAELKLDPENRLLPVDYGDVCLNYDKGWFAEKGLTPPGSLEELAKTEYKGLTVVENPATSSPGLAFLLATVAHFGDPGYLEWWQQMVEQEVLVVDGWEDAYYGQFTRYEGTRPIVVSYASSPPVEVYFADPPATDAPTAAVIGEGACFRQIEFIGILAGTQKRAVAEKLVDFLLSQQFQEDIPLKMFVFPANQKAALPDVFQKYAQLSPKPATLSPADIAANREKWINAWNETVLR
ncbi:MAG: thiamine ABC transporter substrate-binding protein [Anaerolineales bacterium]|nr:thiamine ABC transporter substrate-binding protein [Anaerolineales bacterium]